MNHFDLFHQGVNGSRRRPRGYLTPAEYLVREAASPIRHDYLDGQIYPVEPGGATHDRVAARLAALLRAVAEHCEVCSRDMKVRLVGQNCFYYPDLMMVCNPEDSDPDYRTSPCLLAEVVSMFSDNTDRREKWLGYRELPSLSYYLLLSEDGSRFSYYRRDDQGGWHYFEVYPGQVVEIACGPLQYRLDWEQLYGDALTEPSVPLRVGA